MAELGLFAVWAVTVFVVGLVYLVPTFLAYGRGHEDLGMISLVNVFFGWTLVGWVASLVWCFTREVQRALHRVG